MSNLTPFAFGDIELTETLSIGGVPHATKTAIGTWLGYADPRVAINKILERNPHLMTWSVDVKLTSTDGKNYDSSVFHPVGFLLIVMESGQPRAVARDIEVTRDSFVRAMLLERLGRICLDLGQPMPAVELIGRDPRQLAIPGT